MKDLLHSRVFKKNLIKWLFMYCIVMGMLTIVITYSRYITTFSLNSDDARAAKFAIEINQGDCPENASYDTTCITPSTSNSYQSVRPTDKFSFYFTVDPGNLEVNTLLDVKVKINNIIRENKEGNEIIIGQRPFTDYSLFIYDDTVDNGEEIGYRDISDSDGINIKTSNGELSSLDDFVITISNRINANSEVKSKKYKLVLDYNYDDIGDTENYICGNIVVGYTATQTIN